MANNLVDIVKGIVSSIDLNLTVISITTDTVFLCSTIHVTVGSTVGDGLGNSYMVTDLMDNAFIKVVPIGGAPAQFAGVVVVAPSVTVLHGSPASTNNEYLDIEQVSRDKTPFIWLLESYEYEQGSPDSSVLAKFDARLFFLDLTFLKWDNDEHNDLSIKPMENLQTAFKEVIDNDFTFKRLGNYRVRVRPRFGVEVTNKGSDEKIINEDLSGVEVNMTIELYDLSICNC